MWWGRKPLSVFEFVIYLRNLPPGKERAALICRYIWSCRSVGGTHCMLPYSVVGSYPAFSPLPSEEGGCFLLPLAKDYSLLRFPQTGALSCADFPQLHFLKTGARQWSRDKSSHHYFGLQR